MTDEQLFNEFENGNINGLTELRTKYYGMLSRFLRKSFCIRKRKRINAIIDEAWLTLSFTGFNSELPKNVGSKIHVLATFFAINGLNARIDDRSTWKVSA